jgi:hypothetical protein
MADIPLNVNAAYAPKALPLFYPVECRGCTARSIGIEVCENFCHPHVRWAASFMHNDNESGLDCPVFSNPLSGSFIYA